MTSTMTVQAPSAVLADRFGRVQDYLRLGVTDRCNFRCTYCLPGEGVALGRQDELLTFGEMTLAVEALVEMGVRKVRLTGGEPLLRPGLPDLVARLKETQGIETVALTTNGTRLAFLAAPLCRSGLDAVNVSVDSLDADRFGRVTGGDLAKVLDGIHEALAQGLRVKLNCVVLPDLALEEVRQFAALAQVLPLQVRFIERMPLTGQRWDPSGFLSLDALEKRFHLAWPGLLDPATRPGEDGVARCYRIRDGVGELGFIASLSRPFCERCSRLRLTAVGRLHTCLFSGDGVDLKGHLRGGDLEGVQAAVREAVLAKPRTHGGEQALSPGAPPPSGRIRMMGG